MLNILLVEDSPSDAFLATQALKETKDPVEVHSVNDGVEALAFLRQEGSYAEMPRPDLILLDLNMPRKDGRELLAEIKNNTEFGSIPVIVLTSSGAEQDIAIAYRYHANCYVVKPADFKKFREVIQSIESFWFTNVSFPPNEAGVKSPPAPR
jgi:two-component system, chemotaxis family, response regulator Rcp1